MIDESLNFTERFGRNMRFLFEDNGKYKRLFFISYQNDELYLGSSLKSINCAGPKDVRELNVRNGIFEFSLNPKHKSDKFKALKFSFHKSGVRHLQCLNEKNEKVVLYREKCVKLEELNEPQLLFTIITKRISLYTNYNARLTKGDMNAVTLNTPNEYLDCRNTFEFFISRNPEHKIPSFIISSENNDNQIKPIKLKDGLFLHIRFIVIAPLLNHLNQSYPEREIIIFQHEKAEKLKFFSFE